MRKGRLLRDGAAHQRAGLDAALRQSPRQLDDTAVRQGDREDGGRAAAGRARVDAHALVPLKRLLEDVVVAESPALDLLPAGQLIAAEARVQLGQREVEPGADVREVVRQS